ncbi:SIS domain-containing protein [Cohaesibacter sp. CAU 1516]|uniref:SIS domain-containing protein n=1 Tax=Cohaesibacter sp. CAU 1516 TaxID=2576038 RepID=UPI0010FF40F6|nr:SIS domain-containing protein [Cohaesibacter sp. CAU 1516]TLP48254.1 SIS domain-containing protein [Cohaesibacter sp. CAU 1516]
MTKMREETEEIPVAVERLLKSVPDSIDPVAAALRARDPKVVVTIARGSSDHAAYFMKYAIELVMGLPVASQGPSIASIYGAKMKMDSAAVFAISQSGASADIVAMAKAAREGGALTAALVNTLPSDLANQCELAVDIKAGEEQAVAATKSYVNSIVAGLAILAGWAEDYTLKNALARLPEHLNTALSIDWSEMIEPVSKANSLYMLGRGPTMAIAAEAALKCKETCELHAEAYSSAEMLHGPVSLVDRDFPVIAFAARDAAENSIVEIVNGVVAKNPHCYISSNHAGDAVRLPFVVTGHPLTDALTLIVPFYRFVEQLSRHRGLDPDKPAALKKVTVTR